MRLDVVGLGYTFFLYSPSIFGIQFKEIITHAQTSMGRDVKNRDAFVTAS